MSKNAQTTEQLHSSHTLRKARLKIPQARLLQYVNCEIFQMFKLDLEKVEEPEIKLPISSRKQESSRKTSTSALLSMLKTLSGSHQTVDKS